MVLAVGSYLAARTDRMMIIADQDTLIYIYREYAVAQLVEALPTSQKVAGSIPDGVIGIFH